MPAPLRPLTLLALLLVAGPAGAAVDPGARCIDAKLGGSAAYAKRLLACHARAVKKGAAVDPRCLERADAKLAKVFARAEAKGGCEQVGDLARTRTFAAGLAGRARYSLAPTGGPSRCTATQLKAGGTRVVKAARAHGKLLRKGDDQKFQRELEKLALAFDRKHAKAVKAGDCEGTHDAARAAGFFDAGLDALYAAAALVQSETLTMPSDAAPAETPGSDGVDPNAYPQLVTQFGGTDFSLNNVTYTRYFVSPLLGSVPDAVLILVPGFEGGALTFKILAENAVSRALENGMRLEVWAYDRRGHQLEDLVGQDIAEAALDPQIALDWYFGEALGLPLHPELAAGPNRRAIVHGAQADTAFIANWTELVFSRDLDVLVEAARSVARSQNVYLGGHSAGTGFTARYAATDFNLAGIGAPEPGYAKLRGLVLLEGGAGASRARPRPRTSSIASRTRPTAACSPRSATTRRAASTGRPARAATATARGEGAAPAPSPPPPTRSFRASSTPTSCSPPRPGPSRPRPATPTRDA